MEESPDILTDQLIENDSDLSLLVPTRKLFEGKAAYEGGRSEMWREGRVARGEGSLEIENRENGEKGYRVLLLGRQRSNS
jgi:hypothetical protein